MFRNQHEATWPLLAFFGCLLALSALAPTVWHDEERTPTALQGSRIEAASPSPVATPALDDEETPAAPASEMVVPLALAPAAQPAVPAPRVGANADAEPASEALPAHVEAAAANPLTNGDNPLRPAAGSAPSLPIAAGPVPTPRLPIESETTLAAVEPRVIPGPRAGAATADDAPAPASPPAAGGDLAAQLPKLAYIPQQPGRDPRPDNWPAAARNDLQPPPRSEPPGLAVAEPAARARWWQEPQALLEQLEAQTHVAATKTWAKQTRDAVVELGQAMTKGSDQTETILARLDRLNADASALAGKLDDPNAARRLRQTSYALARRLDVWRQLCKSPADAAAAPVKAQAESHQLALCLAEIEAVTGDSAEGRAWRQFLLVDALRAQAARPSGSGDQIPPALAHDLLLRLHRTQFSAEQRQFIASRPVAKLERAMQRATVGPVDMAGILRHIEQYEQTRLASEGRRLAQDYQALALSPLAEHQQLARRMEMHYRNANLRFAVSERMINRLVPQQAPEFAPVYDRMNGIPTVGKSLISTDIALRMVPDPSRIRLALEINGEVSSFTSSNAGPATFYSRGNTTFVARKPVEIDLDGVRGETPQVEVFNNVRLQDVETDFDALPVFGQIANRIAAQQHEQHRPQIDREVRWKVARQVRQRLDTEAHAQFNQASKRLNEKVLTPLRAMALEPRMISAETTEDRLAMRLRLAGDDQLGGHTVRPHAPADSFASFQVHESALNNAIQRLEFDGRTFTMPELGKQIAAKAGVEPWENDPDIEDVSITFAPRDAVSVQFHDGQVAITLKIAKLAKPPRAWRNFAVTANYRPQVSGREAELVRDGLIHLEGDNLNTGAQIALRGIFSRTFSRKQPWKLTPEAVLSGPEFADLAITQFTLDEGWLAVALGPKRTAMLRPGVLRR